jgi:hypothetical protein
LESGFARKPNLSLAIRHAFAGFGLSGSAETGNALVYQRPTSINARSNYDGYRYNGFSISLDKELGPIQLVTTASWLGERQTVLGALFADSFGQNGAQSVFVDGGGKAMLGDDWQIAANWRQGWTWANRSATVTTNSLLKSNAFSFDIARNNAFLPGDKLAFRVSQPLRVTGGGISLNLPISYDYATESAAFGIRRVNLAPKGHEIASELSWLIPLDSGSFSSNLFWRQEPGHFQNAPDDLGVAFRLSFGF